MATLLAGIPGLYDGGTPLGNVGDNLGTTTEDHQDNRVPGGNELLDILLLTARQSQSPAVAVFAAEHDVLANGSNNHVGLTSHTKGFLLVGLLARFHLTVQDLILPGTCVAAPLEVGLYLFRPVASA